MGAVLFFAELQVMPLENGVAILRTTGVRQLFRSPRQKSFKMTRFVPGEARDMALCV